METSRPLNVLMKAANAPAQVMPLRMLPHGSVLRCWFVGLAESERVRKGEDEIEPALVVAAFSLSDLPVCSLRMRGNSSTTLSVPFAPAAAYKPGRRFRPITPKTG